MIQRLVEERPTYGYRRVTALVNRMQAAEGKPTVNHKLVFPDHEAAWALVAMRSDLRWSHRCP